LQPEIAGARKGEVVVKADFVPRPRKDAQRNRERLLAEAVVAFTRDADASLEGIARAAGVGIGTLYRHYPTREALVEAAYRSELAKICSAAAELLRHHPPDVALRRWMDRFLDYMATKRAMSDALRAVIAAGGQPFSETRARLTEAVSTLLGAGVGAGILRDGVTAEDVLMGLSGMAYALHDPAQRAQAGRLADLLLDGLRFGAPLAAGPTRKKVARSRPRSSPSSPKR
jgi:AcrR family transcriptional regulator